MKRAVGLIILLVLLLTGCVAVPVDPPVPQEPYSQFVGNTEYMVAPASKTITANGHVFTYAYTEDGVEITYPNGAIYRHVNINEWASTGSWINADADFSSNNGNDYADCHALMMVVPEKTAKKTMEVDRETVFGIIGGLCLVGVGVWMCTKPESHFYWTKGWWFENAEPSEWALSVTTVSGWLMIIGGVIMAIVSIIMCFS